MLLHRIQHRRWKETKQKRGCDLALLGFPSFPLPFNGLFISSETIFCWPYFGFLPLLLICYAHPARFSCAHAESCKLSNFLSKRPMRKSGCRAPVERIRQILGILHFPNCVELMMHACLRLVVCATLPQRDLKWLLKSFPATKRERAIQQPRGHWGNGDEHARWRSS